MIVDDDRKNQLVFRKCITEYKEQPLECTCGEVEFNPCLSCEIGKKILEGPVEENEHTTS